MRWLWSVLALSASHTPPQCGRGLSSCTHMQLTLLKKKYFLSIFREVLYIVYLLSLSLLEKYGSDNPRLAVILAYWNLKPELTRELLLARVIHPLHTEASLSQELQCKTWENNDGFTKLLINEQLVNSNYWNHWSENPHEMLGERNTWTFSTGQDLNKIKKRWEKENTVILPENKRIFL